MSAEQVVQPVVQGRVVSEILTPPQVKKLHADNLAMYRHMKDGIHHIPPNPSLTKQVQELALELETRTEALIASYKDLYERANPKRTVSLKTNLCDHRLTDFMGDYMGILLPEWGGHGVVDVNTTAFRTLSLYIRENNLADGNYFLLNDKLKILFMQMSIVDPTKTYLQVADDRIQVLRSKKGVSEPNGKSAEIMYAENDSIYMNYAALRTILPSFKVDYVPIDAETFLSAIVDFDQKVKERDTALEEAKKAAKKQQKAAVSK